MFKIICVTNRLLCDNFLECIESLHKNKIPVILREKDLSLTAYTRLAADVKEICPDVIAHYYPEAAKDVGIDKIHLPLHLMNKDIRNEFSTVGISVHSVDEAIEAQNMGADYVTAGHIFRTDCKKDLKPRGIDFLKTVAKSVHIPVYAIGGIKPENISKIVNTGAKGCCIMSGFMKCDNISKYTSSLHNYISEK